MPQAIVDPEELRDFARNLKKFNNDLREHSRALANQLAGLSTPGGTRSTRNSRCSSTKA